MPLKIFLVALLALAANGATQAQDLASTCHASSSYDLTLSPDALLFDRAAPAPQRVELHAGKLAISTKGINQLHLPRRLALGLEQPVVRHNNCRATTEGSGVATASI